MIKKYILLPVILFVIVFSYNNFGDRAAYKKKVNLIKRNEKIAVIHHHEWSDNTIIKLGQMFSGIPELEKGITSKQNDFSYIEVIELETGNIIFKKPSPAFTYICISNDSKYILGLSYIQYFNPFQLILYSVEGTELLKKHIAPREAKLTRIEFEKFKERFKTKFNYLQSLNAIIKYNGFIYIDCSRLGMPNILGKAAWNDLYHKDDFSHYSKNFSEITVNYIFWYFGSLIMDKSQQGKNPEVKFIYKKGELYSISLLDLKRERFEIPIKENIVY